MTYSRVSSSDYVLKDVFETMVDRLRKMPPEKRGSVDIKDLFDTSSKFVLDANLQRQREILRDNKDAILGMAEEWARTGKPVRTRW